MRHGGPSIRSLGPALGLVFTWVLFALLAGGDFVALENQRLMLLQTAVVGSAAVGATLIVALGGIDLSVGSTIALGTMIGAMHLRGEPSFVLALLGCLATGAACGALIGALVIGELARVVGLVGGALIAWFVSREHGTVAGVGAGVAFAVIIAFGFARFVPKVPLSPFIVTLGAWGALRGLAKGLGDNQPVYPTSMGWIEDLMQPAQHGPLAFLPPGVWILLALALVGAFVLRRTVLGANLLAIGSNADTARLSGIDVERTKLLVYVLGIGCAGVAALLQLSYLSMGDPTTAQGAELKVIAAVVIGGASLSGGAGSILGTLFGALLMTVVDNGCTKLGLDNWVQECVTGAIIVAAVVVDRLRHTGAT
ncbi:MAG: ABC transporter permease [Planctomycetes bacterium]|nr:ABC transporter permease [Planctomycetota bacterium]